MDEIEESECSICYNKIGERNNCITPCGHTFCLTCIIEVIRRDCNTCPNCRTLLTEEPNEIDLIENNTLDENNEINENILNNNILNENNYINNYININNDILNVNDYNIIENINLINNNILIDNNSDTLSISEYSTSISDIPDDELYDNDNFNITPRQIQLYNETNPSEKISIIVSLLLEKGFDETDIRYIIRKNFNYHIMTESKERDDQELIFLEMKTENIKILQNELNKILSELEVNINDDNNNILLKENYYT